MEEACAGGVAVSVTIDHRLDASHGRPVSGNDRVHIGLAFIREARPGPEPVHQTNLHRLRRGGQPNVAGHGQRDAAADAGRLDQGEGPLQAGRQCLDRVAGDMLSGEREVLDKRESKSRPKTGMVSVRTRGFNQHGKLVDEFDRGMLIAKRGCDVDQKAGY